MSKHKNKQKGGQKAAIAPKTGRVRWFVAGAVVVVGVVVVAKFWPGPVAGQADAAAGSAFGPTIPNKTPAPGPAPEGMVWIPGGEFSMGSDESGESLCGLPGVTRDAQPIHRVYVDGFWMDQTDVTNEKFEEFVKATGYFTIAERTPT
jgi:formylglycine-generating enzyme required for sulfatase activity